MNDADDEMDLPAEPERETEIRHPKGNETKHGDDQIPKRKTPWKCGQVVANFKLLSKLGSGATSTVYEATELDTGRVCALKLMQTQSAGSLAAACTGFHRMLPIWNPSLVRLKRILRLAPDTIGMTMEVVRGKRLMKVIAQTRASGNVEACIELAQRLLLHIGGALETMHMAGLVHRDVKPDNMMIDESGRARLIDYGLVGTCDPEHDPDAQRNYLAGTYWYMAPESISKQIYPPACDVYALGCVLLELLTKNKTLPKTVEGQSLVQTVGDVREFLMPDLPAELVDVIVDMVDADLEIRPLASRLARGQPSSTSATARYVNPRLHSKLLGRTDELKVAARWIQSVVDRRPTRLHISGESGIGKSALLAEIQRSIKKVPWFQVFNSTCRQRVDVPLQAFDAMADVIARRYSHEDREPLRMKAEHATVLRQAFPSLQAVIPVPASPDAESKFDPNGKTPDLDGMIDRGDALLAGVALVDQMCSYGPVFLIVDDIQWADQDSLNVLDRLLQDAKASVGIITVGTGIDGFRKPPNALIELPPLDSQIAEQLLGELLDRAVVPWTPVGMKQLALLSEGNPYRLTQLAVSVNQSQSIDWSQRLSDGTMKLDELWFHRLEDLRPDARAALECLAVAGGPTALNDLATVSGLEMRTADAIRDLVSQHLVVDDSLSRDAIDIIHQWVAQRILETIPPTRCDELHEKWAKQLLTREKNLWRAARVAGHFLAAHHSSAAIIHMKQAAKDAETRFAFTEAAKWHRRVANLSTGCQAATSLWEASIDYGKAGCPADAATALIDLIAHPGSDHLAAYEALPTLLAEQQLRSGQWSASVRTTIKLVDQRDLTARRTRAMAKLIRPMLILKPLLAIRLLRRFHRSEPLATIDRCLIESRQPGTRRRRSLQCLQSMIDQACVAGDLKAQTYAQTGLAIAHWCASDWSAAIEPCGKAIRRFHRRKRLRRLVESVAVVPAMWSCFWLGRLREMHSYHELMHSLAIEQKDDYLFQLSHTGFGIGSLLVSDRVDDAKAALMRLRQSTRAAKSVGVAGLYVIAAMLFSIYENRSSSALRYASWLHHGEGLKWLQQLQTVRLAALQLEALAHLRIANQQPLQRTKSIEYVWRLTHLLRRELNPYAAAMATAYDAQAAEIIGERASSLELYTLAAEMADSLDLVPLRLVYAGRIRTIKGRKQASELGTFLTNENVQNVEKFSRFYSGLNP